ncbi:hypothetical protein [Desulfoluna spongiiphila]|uniref:Uncharacterized protein n=1 Tax=Desulfoluna spongiiphila TaxID=419481 RepID=A0A1G5G0I5_9BACT|nr:hypothetical protein [Desulfoluna spongiiphila]SCY45016.1 hypothetical protein SAMN05216233_109125 [Desulfoluna spongiiphila]
MKPHEAAAAIKTGFKYFTLNGLRGRPNIEKREDFERMVSVWAENLTEVPVGVFIAACKSLSCELTFYPAFAEVRQRCLDLMHGKPQQALEVWSEIKRKMSAVSHPYANPEDRDAVLASITCPIARETAGKFDWKAFGLSDESDESYHKGQFEKLFNSVRDRVGIKKEVVRLGVAAPASVRGLVGKVSEQISEEGGAA